MMLVEKFHQMESENNLFNLGEEINISIWDIVRYNVYRKLLYTEINSAKLETPHKPSLVSYIIIFKELIKYFFMLLFANKSIIVFTNSRFKNSEGKYFDKSASHIIKTLKVKYFVIETILGKKTTYAHHYDLSFIVKRLFKTKPLNSIYFDVINNAIINNFGFNPLSKKEFDNLIGNYKAQYHFYKFLFKIINPTKLIIATGNPKASVKVANERGIKSYLLQHATIEKHEIDYSYPCEIKCSDNILFPTTLLTFGEYWGKNMNIPTYEIITIGNDNLEGIPPHVIDNSILFVSTIIHGEELSKFALKVSHKWPDKKIVFKLHPNEYKNRQAYNELFKQYSNINVISDEISTNILIAKSRSVVLIVSSVLYEALQQKKVVAVFKRINYEILTSLQVADNLCFFDNIDEFEKIDSKKSVTVDYCFYEKSNYSLIDEIFNTNT
jgi:hypothetical protein